MERLFSIAIILPLLGLVGYMTVYSNPYEREIAAVRAEGDRLDAEIQTARTQQDCERLATIHLARRMSVAVNPPPQLKPDIEELLWPRDRHEYRDPNMEALEEMVEMAVQMISAGGDAALYLVACLRHLQDIGVQDMRESFDDI